MFVAVETKVAATRQASAEAERMIDGAILHVNTGLMIPRRSNCAFDLIFNSFKLQIAVVAVAPVTGRLLV